MICTVIAILVGCNVVNLCSNENAPRAMAWQAPDLTSRTADNQCISYFSPHFSKWSQTLVREVLPNVGFSEARKLRTKRVRNLFFGKQENLDYIL